MNNYILMYFEVVNFVSIEKVHPVKANSKQEFILLLANAVKEAKKTIGRQRASIHDMNLYIDYRSLLSKGCALLTVDEWIKIVHSNGNNDCIYYENLINLNELM